METEFYRDSIFPRFRLSFCLLAHLFCAHAVEVSLGVPDDGAVVAGLDVLADVAGEGFGGDDERASAVVGDLDPDGDGSAAIGDVVGDVHQLGPRALGGLDVGDERLELRGGGGDQRNADREDAEEGGHGGRGRF